MHGGGAGHRGVQHPYVRQGVLLAQASQSLLRPKYEAVYLREIADGSAERVVGSWIAFYNELRPHSALDGRTPGDVYRSALGKAA